LLLTRLFLPKALKSSVLKGKKAHVILC